MTEPDNPDVAVVDCATCDGGGVTSHRCTCTWYGDQLIVDADQPTTADPNPGGTAYRDCQVCLGTGTTCATCDRCAGLGRRRAQLVYTVANADTAAVASVSIVPGALDPVHRDGRWSLDLDAVLADLAGQTGVEHLYDPEMPDRDIVLGGLLLPRDWRPDLPEARRYALEAEAIAGCAAYPWRIWLGHAASPQRPDPARHLGRLCALAELLCLDLVVEARPDPYGDDRHRWQLRLELPDTAVGDDFAGGVGSGDTLDAAIVAADITTIATGLADRSRAAPAHYLRPGRPSTPAEPSTPDLDQLERRMIADCVALGTGEPTPGAHAIWRDGRWWHTSLRVVAVVEELTERATGQIRRRTVDKLARAWQPPPPSWQGPPIPSEPCSYCVPEQGLRRCVCTIGASTADPDCRHCGGAGRAGRYAAGLSRCFSCGDTLQIRYGAVVTVTDGRHWARHLNWAVPDSAVFDEAAAAPGIGSQPGGKPIHQVPPPLRLATHLDDLAVRGQPITGPDQLAPLDDYESLLTQELWYGHVTLDHPGQEPFAAYLANVANGRPGGRVLLHAATPDAPPLARVLALAYGLGLALIVTVADHRHHAGTPYQTQGVSWGAYVAAPGASLGLRAYPHQSSLGHALAHAMEYVCGSARSAVPADPSTAIAVPQNVPSPPPDGPEPDGLVPLLSLLAAHYAGETVIVVLAASHCDVYLRDGPEITRRVVAAADLPRAVERVRHIR
ncbi:hypothetical protein O7632_08235 [Solwaraspora sp. WMMD406]|uniref:hypothetical protein n=1 Tax=Solwaraspora sp. WMMD406 TaxID=3016095 RepID=UPI00241601EB|nr:hypothetical protein [Solwaraspora sp. WMMD406]MDG4764093.1 hypothetical protein [Solwaraspora sp. WMMD406]